MRITFFKIESITEHYQLVFGTLPNSGLMESPPLQRQLLVLDIDETLVFADFKPLVDYDFIIHVSQIPIWVKKRPGLDKFLEEISKLYDLAVFSASNREYVRAVVAKIIPYPLKFIYSSERCTDHFFYNYNSGNCRANVKKLSKIWSQNNHYTRYNTLIIDDYPDTYMLNYGNSIPIIPYEGKKHDNEFDRIMQLLRSLHGMRDIRKVEKRITP